MSSPNLKLVPTRGIDHLAFVTDDLPATLDFYTRVVGLQLVHVRRVPFERENGRLTVNVQVEGTAKQEIAKQEAR